jgi:hypothetical protein
MQEDFGCPRTPADVDLRAVTTECRNVILHEFSPAWRTDQRLRSSIWDVSPQVWASIDSPRTTFRRGTMKGESTSHYRSHHLDRPHVIVP